jgi:hypothetical protein
LANANVSIIKLVQFIKKLKQQEELYKEQSNLKPLEFFGRMQRDKHSMFKDITTI